MKYFTGMKNIILLPNFCGYVNATYSYPSLAVNGSGSVTTSSNLWEHVLIAPSRGVNEVVLADLRAALHRFNSQVNKPLPTSCYLYVNQYRQYCERASRILL